MILIMKNENNIGNENKNNIWWKRMILIMKNENNI